MTAIQIHRHIIGQVICRDCEFNEQSTADPRSPDIPQILSDGAMHAMSENHKVHGHIEDDRDIEPIGGDYDDPRWEHA
jgi:hypothetical protein